MGEAHHSRYSTHPGATKMCHDIRGIYWWDVMKKDIAVFVAQCPNCQQIEVLTANFWRSFQKGLGTQVYIGDHSKVIPVDDVQFIEQLSYDEAPIAILDRQVRRLRTNDVDSVKVLWIKNNVEEMTWEAEEEMKTSYPHLFPLSEEDQIETSIL
ncbi:uncharacterized protein [Nicotiana tomentosiformis]|uniref:uncharacterized protein n=1 Tax=Nicotiana tomentosiformis TaxID=4098 RepID=UPI00388CC3A7